MSEERYRGLLASLDSVVAALDEQGRILYANQRAAERLDSTTEAMIGKTLAELLPEPFASAHLQVLDAIFRDGQSQTIETESLVLGRPHWYRITLQPIHDDHGRISYVLVNAADIHDLKTTQQELRELNQSLEARVVARTAEFQNLYDHAPNGYHSLDANGNFLMINQTALNWLGYCREDLIGQPFTKIVSPRNYATFAENFPHFKQQGWLKDIEFELQRKDGTSFPALINAMAVYDPDGNFVMSRSTVFDNTERKRAEQTLRQANAEMQRTLRTRDEFLATMSHELRTPLNAVLAISEGLLEGVRGELSSAQQQALHQIESSGRHLLMLINDILDLSKIEAGRLELQLEPVAVADMCRASLQFVRELALKKQLQISFRLNDELAQFYADPRRLKQMLVNLLSNAVKFTPPGGKVSLVVEVWAERGLINFIVRDSGIGIQPIDLPRLFQPFSQLDSSLSRQHEGSGLGLVLVRRLAELHHGSIAVESQPGVGSCFTLSLSYRPVASPITHEHLSQAPLSLHPASANPAPSSDPPVMAQDQPAQKRILIAEDNQVNLEVVHDYLAQKGFVILIARNGREAITQAELHQPDLILMDIQMPELDGLSAIKRLRTGGPCTATPIIALTALAMTGDRERCLAAGASAYMTKPISLKELVASIHHLLG